jgi:uncharacterized protein
LVIDSDVHCAAPDLGDILPFLNEQWREYIAENGFRVPATVPYTYPRWLPQVATSPESTTLDQLRRHVLDRSDYAVLNCYYGLEPVRHPFFASAMAAALNDWMRSRWLDQDDRLLGSIVVTPQHADLAAAEIDRVAEDSRFVQVLLPVRSWEAYGNRRYAMIWEAAARHDLAVAIHFGGWAGNPPSGAGWLDSYVEEYAAVAQVFEAQVSSLVVEGIFETHPRLRVVLLESGWTWLPALVWRLDKEWRSQRREVPWIKRPPSEYVRQHVRATIQPLDVPAQASQLAELLVQLGSDEMLMYSSDYPHDHASDSEQLFSVVSPEQAQRVRWDNAWDTYGLDSRLGQVTG